MTPQDFIEKWGPGGPAFDLNERQGAQPHFIDLCQLLGVPTPGSQGDYIFEQDTLVLGEARGYADVFKRDHFAWENKAPGKNLDTALKQLLTYSLALSNPPLLVVCDRLTIRIHTQFNGHPSEVHTVLLGELDQPAKQSLLRRLWTDPESFRPQKTSRDITEDAAKSFSTLAEGLRRRDAANAEITQQHANQVAHFLTQCLFCFFAEDVGLLPGRMFERLVNNKNLTSDKLRLGLTNLFTAMCDGGLYGNDDIPWFNGGLFKKVNVPALTIMEVTELRNAAALNWSAIDVSIFGTLFERGLDPSKRSQLGAHYTDPATILRIVDPVLSRPLLQKWELVAQDIRALMAKSSNKKSAAIKLPGQKKRQASPGDKSYQQAQRLFLDWLDFLRDYRVLDPACGSGNFLFLGLKALKDIEHKSHLDAAAFGLDREADLVTGPHNVLGIELNEYAAELARVTVWIGELQWRMAHGYDFKTNPVLEQLDNIECRDALLSFIEPGARAALPTLSAEATEENGVGSEFMRDTSPKAANLKRNSALTPLSGTAEAKQVVEATWPKANVVIGNPPFLGGKKFVKELGENYANTLRTVFSGRVPGLADLVAYWFEKARAQMMAGQLSVAGLVATNSLRDGFGREVLKRLNNDTPIFEVWSDEPWINEGAAVRVSLIAFSPLVQDRTLNGNRVDGITSDLNATSVSDAVDVTTAKPLPGGEGVAFQGTTRSGPFDIPGNTARSWLAFPNPNGKSNADVVRPWSNGLDVTRRPSDTWIVDFGISMTAAEASLYEAPYEHCRLHVKPTREKNRNPKLVEQWWHYDGVRVGMRKAILPLRRYIVTTITAKYRIFVWFHPTKLPDATLVAFARSDDVTFGVLHSRFHEVWSLHVGSTLEDRPRYVPGACFETFPFPAGLTPADTADQRTELVAGGALIPGIWGQSPGLGVLPNSTETMSASGHAKLEFDPKFPATVASQHSAAGVVSIRDVAITIATAAKRLNDLRENWLNPPEWTHRVPEVVPLSMSESPYPDRIEPKPGISQTDLKALQQRTLTHLYNLSPAWLALAHQQLDAAVASAYGWNDYTPDMPDEEILKRLLALNLERSAN